MTTTRKTTAQARPTVTGIEATPAGRYRAVLSNGRKTVALATRDEAKREGARIALGDTRRP